MHSGQPIGARVSTVTILRAQREKIPALTGILDTVPGSPVGICLAYKSPRKTGLVLPVQPLILKDVMDIPEPPRLLPSPRRWSGPCGELSSFLATLAVVLVVLTFAVFIVVLITVGR
jgi:hypothetical protein